jgi:hypothetical protein
VIATARSTGFVPQTTCISYRTQTHPTHPTYPTYPTHRTYLADPPYFCLTA